MNDIAKLWKNRIVEYNQELRKYLKYMFNDHLLFVLIFALGGGAYTYNQWVQTLDSSFPAPLIMSITLAFILAWSPVYTFLREADSVFLLPLEGRLKSYFHKGIWTSFLFQSYIVLLVLAALMPMYVQVTDSEFKRFFPLLGIVLLLKLWNLYTRWCMLKYQEKEIHLTDTLVRLALNGVLLLLITSDASILLILVVAVVMLGYLYYFTRVTKQKSLKWDLLINLEQQRMLLFYRMANMFTDVPKLKGKIHRRKWLDFLVNNSKFEQGQTFRYLYVRSLIRTSEYFGLYIRLTLIAFVLIYSNSSFVLSIIIFVLFMYLTGFQIIPLYKRFDFKIWVMIYPVPSGIKVASFQKLMNQALMIQAFLLSLPLFIKAEWLQGLILLLAGLSFSIFFSQFYLVKRLKKMEEKFY